MIEIEKFAKDFFQQKRNIPRHHKTITCYAAFNHMRIKRNGMMMPCCFSTSHQKWEKGKTSLKDYWFGGVNEEYQDDFLEGGLSRGCVKSCGSRINKLLPPPIYDYDWNVGDERLEHAMDPDSWPKVFEFEISNLCNMACVMCMGELSSKHMLGRDKDLKKYDQNTFDDDENLEQLLIELEEFIPHLHTIRFTGGEPFAHKGFYRIAELVTKLNPNMVIDITTNGSIYNTKVDKFAKLLNMKLSMSLDTVIKDEYDKIRIGGVHSETLGNIQKFKNVLGSDNIKINSTLMSINCLNIDTFFQYAFDNNFEPFINGYDRHGREHTIDWNVSNIDIHQRREVIDILQNKWIRKKHHLQLGDSFIEAVKKTITLLEPKLYVE